VDTQKQAIIKKIEKETAPPTPNMIQSDIRKILVKGTKKRKSTTVTIEEMPELE